MTQPKKPFLPSKQQLKGCGWVILWGMVILTSPVLIKFTAYQIIIILAAISWFCYWLYRRKRKLNKQQKNLEITEVDLTEEEYKNEVWGMYRKESATASPTKIASLNRRMERWQELMKTGLTAREAYTKAKEEESDKIHH